MAGTWKPGFYYGSIKDGFTGPRAVRPRRERGDEGRDRRQDEGDRGRARSTSSPGPLYDQSGKLRVPKGVRMDVLKGGTNSLYGMNWLVKGVIGSPKG